MAKEDTKEKQIDQAIEEMKKFTFNPVDYPIFTTQINSFKPFQEFF